MSEVCAHVVVQEGENGDLHQAGSTKTVYATSADPNVAQESNHQTVFHAEDI